LAFFEKFYADEFMSKNRKMHCMVEGVEKQDRICYTSSLSVNLTITE